MDINNVNWRMVLVRRRLLQIQEILSLSYFQSCIEYSLVILMRGRRHELSKV